MSNLPYTVKFKLPLQYLSVDDWNNFVNDLLFILQYGPGKWLEYYQNGNMSNLNVVKAKTGNFTDLEVNGYQALWNLKPVETYTFPIVFENWLNDLQNVVAEFNEVLEELQTMKIPIYPVKTIPEAWLNVLSQFDKKSVSVSLKAYGEQLKQLSYLLSKFRYKLYTAFLETFQPANAISGLQATISGSVNLASLVPAPLANFVRYAILRNIGTVPIQINDGIYLMPGDTLRARIVDITVKSLNEITLTSNQAVPVGLIFGAAVPIAVYAITVQNSQSDPTPSPFQLLLNLNLQGVIPSTSISNLLSLLFCQDAQCTKPLYAWIESYSSNLSSVNVWVLLPNSIPANSTVTFYMAVIPQNNYPYTGIAPQLTSTYAQYDNGTNVFVFYDNFAGTSLNTNKWSSYGSSATFTVDNGITIQTSGSSTYGAIITNTGFSSQTVFDAYLASFSVQSSSYNSAMGIGAQTANSDSADGYQYTSWNASNSNGGTISYGTLSGGITNIQAGPNFPNSGNAVLSGYWLATGNEGFAVNYDFVTSTNSSVSIGSANYYAMGGWTSSQSATSVWYWARVRAMPPNNVMPSLVYFLRI
jgi:hypothetical protein